MGYLLDRMHKKYPQWEGYKFWLWFFTRLAFIGCYVIFLLYMRQIAITIAENPCNMHPINWTMLQNISNMTFINTTP